MIYHFKIISQEAKDFCIEFEIDGNNSFYDMHETIQKSTGYLSLHLASFFIANKKGEKQIEISLLDSGVNGYPNYSMHNTKIAELISSDSKYIYYTFDLFNDRSFILELIEIFMNKNLNETVITLEQGDAPVQVLEMDLPEEKSTAVQEDEVFHDFGVLDDYTKIFGELDE